MSKRNTEQYITVIENNKSIFDLNYHNFRSVGIKSNKSIINLNHKNKYKNVEDVYNFIIYCIKKNIINKHTNYKLNELYNDIPFIYYTNDNMIIDYHTNIYKCILDIDLKYDNEHIIIDKLDEIKKDNLSEIYDILIKNFINLLKLYFNYDKSLLEEKYYKYVLSLELLNDNNILIENIYKYVYSNKIIDYNINKKYYNKNATNVHLYFPLIFINKYDFLFLRDKLIECMNILYPYYIWDKIIDKAMDHNGFRLLYTNKPLLQSFFINNTNHIVYLNKDIINYKPNYYVINFDKSTLKLNKNDYYSHLFITSMQSPYNKSFLNIKKEYNNEYNKYINNNNQNIKNNNQNIKNNKNKIKLNNKSYNNLDNIKNINITKELKKVFNLISINRINEYTSWFKIICLCNTYNLYSFCIELSKKSDKYDNNSLYKINKEFLKPLNPNKRININSLFYWIMKDNNITYDKNKKKFKYNELISLLLNNNINIDLLNEELKNLNCNFSINTLFINEITINNLIKLNIKENIINYYEVENEFINENDFNKIKDYNNICLISPVGSGKTTTIKKLIQYWNNKYINKIINKYSNIIYLDNKHLNKLINSNSWKLQDKNEIKEYINENIILTNDYNKELHNYIYLKIIFISSLISLGDKFYIDFKEFNIINYIDIGYNYNDYDNIIISLEQLYKLLNNYDIVIIDEFTSFISRFLSITNNNISNNYNSLLKICKKSKYIILCDAIYREDSFLLTKKLFNCNNKNYIFYYNKYKKCHNKIINNYLFNKEFNINNNIISFLNKFNINNQINNNDNIIICSDSVKICKLIYDYFINLYKNQKEYFIIITKDNYNKEIINDCNNTFKNKCVIFSPKITYGIDIQIKYNNIYCIYKGKSINSYLMMQQLSRSRNCNNINILSLFKDKKISKKILSFNLFKDIYLKHIKHIKKDKKLNNLLKNNNIINYIDVILNMNEKINKKYNDYMDFIEIIIYNKYYEYLTRNNKLISLKFICEYQGYKFNNYKLDNLTNDNILINNENNDNYINIILNELNLNKNYNSLNNIINNDNISNDIKNKYINIKNELDEILNKKINKNRIIKSKYLFTNNFNNLNKLFNNKNEDLIKIINNNNNNLYNVYQILINLNKTFNINKFELLEEYNKDNLNNFITNNKENINKLYISKDNNKDKLKNKSFDNLLKEVNNNKMNKKLKIINGLYFFNQFILNCYKFIDNNLIKTKNIDIYINKKRYQKELIFNNKYINLLNILFNIKNINIDINF